ncbi:MAG: AbrB/MazE/SpoVT family DNA-binding domain-containing protein [Nitrososphaerales archaeon]
MVNNVEDSVTIDKQGRLVLPSHIREVLGLKEGGQVSIRLDGSRVILEPISKDIKEKVQEWANIALSLKVEAFTEEYNESWKWMSREYARKKLGLS